ncbi:MAG: M48 family metalloprotease [bacterium]|nr:M48 family metalloprotease [bacterium]
MKATPFRQFLSYVLVTLLLFPAGSFARPSSEPVSAEQALALIENSYSDFFASVNEDFRIDDSVFEKVRDTLKKQDVAAIAPLDEKVRKLELEQGVVRGERKQINKDILSALVQVERLERKRDKLKDEKGDTADLDQEIKKLKDFIGEKQEKSEALKRKLDGDTTFDFSKTDERLEDLDEAIAVAQDSGQDSAEFTKERDALKAKLDEASGLKRAVRNAKLERYLVQAKNSHRFSKLESLKTWPARLRQINETILAGKQDERKLGNVEDIGDLKKRKTDKVRPYKILPGMISKESEIQLGQQIAQDILRTAKVHKDTRVTEYVNRLCQNIARNSDAWSPITCYTLADPSKEREINAFALPGGQIFIHDTLILAMKSEGEVAAVVAHEIAHVNARHSAKMISKMQWQQYAAMAGIIFGGIGYLGYNGIGMLMNIEALGITRASESEADLLGGQYLWNAGYDPRLLTGSFDRLLKDQKLGGTSFWRTHPSLNDRMERVEQEARYLPPKANYVTDTSEFVEIQKAIREERLGIAKVREAENKDGPKLKRPGEGDGQEPETPGRPTLKRTPKPTEPEQKPDNPQEEGKTGTTKTP